MRYTIHDFVKLYRLITNKNNNNTSDTIILFLLTLHNIIPIKDIYSNREKTKYDRYRVIYMQSTTTLLEDIYTHLIQFVLNRFSLKTKLFCSLAVLCSATDLPSTATLRNLHTKHPHYQHLQYQPWQYHPQYQPLIIIILIICLNVT